MSNGNAEKSVGEIVQEVSEKASLLVREEIALAKAEVTNKVQKLGKGAAVAAAAGVFLVFAFFIFLFFLANIINDAFNWNDLWQGYLVVFGLLVALAALAGFLAVRLFKAGAPPTPDMAIEEAQLTRRQFEHQKIERDQLGRSQDDVEQIERGA